MTAAKHSETKEPPPPGAPSLCAVGQPVSAHGAWQLSILLGATAVVATSAPGPEVWNYF